MTTALVYCPHTFNGEGPSASCANIVANFGYGMRSEVFALRRRISIPGPVVLRPAITSPLRHLPAEAITKRAEAKLNAAFADALDRADPANTVAYFWPMPPNDLIRHARSRGIPTVREMINSACATSSQILREAHTRLGISSPLLPVEKTAPIETEELRLYDFVFASNPEVEKSLSALGIPQESILKTTFGWDPDRFRGSASLARSRTPRFVFVGTLGVRKGIPDLLEAWQRADVDGELVLAGRSENRTIDALVKSHARTGRVRQVGHVRDLGPLLRSSDVFVFPTLEEGGPQVTYEAAGCGLPVITTPMGAARMVSDGVNGLIVEPGSVEQLAEAIRSLASQPDLRARLGEAARHDADRFTYGRVGLERSKLITEAVARLHSSR